MRSRACGAPYPRDRLSLLPIPFMTDTHRPMGLLIRQPKHPPRPVRLAPLAATAACAAGFCLLRRCGTGVPGRSVDFPPNAGTRLPHWAHRAGIERVSLRSLRVEERTVSAYDATETHVTARVHCLRSAGWDACADDHHSTIFHLHPWLWPTVIRLPFQH